MLISAALVGSLVAVAVGSIILFWNLFGEFILVTGGNILSSNPFLQAILIPSLLGAIIYCIQVVTSYVFSNYISPYLYSYITIRNSEVEYFDAVLDFVQDQELLKASHLMACKAKKGKSWKERVQEWLSGDKVIEEVHYRPANTGAVIAIKYKTRTLYVTRKTGQTVTVGWDRKAVDMETLTLSVFGMDPTILKNFIADALERVRRVKTEAVDIYVASTGWMEGWEKVRIYMNTTVLRSTHSNCTLTSVLWCCAGPQQEASLCQLGRARPRPDQGSDRRRAQVP